MNPSSTISRFLMIRMHDALLCRRRIEHFLERSEADAAHDIDQTIFGRRTDLQVVLQNLFDCTDDLRARERLPQHLTDARIVPGRATEHELVELLALLVDAEDADVADVVMTAGVDATRDLQVQLTEVVLVIDVLEAFHDREPDWDRTRVRETAVIEPGASDQVGQLVRVRRGEPERRELAMQL